MNVQSPSDALTPRFGPHEPPATVRYHGLDALRAVALLLGVVLHAGLAYLPGGGIGWAVQDRRTHILFGCGILVVHSFRLPIFFLIAGFFGRLMHQRRGTWGFIRNRLGRIIVPFLLGWLLVGPFLAFAWIWGSMHGDPSMAGLALKLGFGETHKQLLRLWNFTSLTPEFPLTHLWFLYVLLQIYALLIACRFLVVRVFDKSGVGLAWVDRQLRNVMHSRWLLPVLAIPTSAILLAMKHWVIDTPDRSFAPHFPTLLLYGAVFSLGWLMQRQVELLDVLRERWRQHLVIGTLTIVPVLLLVGYEWRGPQQPYFQAIRGGYLLLYATMLWSWVLASMGIFLRFCSSESHTWRYLADASYWIYIVHLPIVCALQVALSRFDFSCWAKFGLITAVSIVACLASYHFLVRSTPIGLLLNGRRWPFRWLPTSETNQ
jgi:glucans biosynthesis protein C